MKYYSINRSNKQFKSIIIIILSLLVIYITNFYICFFTNNRLKYKEVGSLDQINILNKLESLYEYSIIEDDSSYTLEECNNLINKELDIYHIKIFIKTNKCGFCFPLINIVFINKDLKDDKEQYIITYAHELIHLKESTNNERYTQYMTFIKLFESGNTLFKRCALKLAIQVFEKRYPLSYDCSFYIKEYLQIKGVI